ncbi:sulfotransferase family protein [Tuwongella immobilis]|uniref:Sulfotransferase domain-containing protein n=1 Tax=Tuwongella immobilis TaxID=692036 RepID=A0A6C2YNI3_9BACT|nr:sulfotransferase [Tuwongella immobilis]VIP03178.1 sulfotransferase domain protein : Uncharacterized protein OS=Mycobacterium canettii (strain CIPT 140010059) GN=MCAN_05811 PE=4 SV=1: Sulfotransfer_3 [Tuwongella immobilis]VTS03621.1 sulfotransferase domain protein : Uncharacterized protein OS=Mycobacterium canettii (strain CIPT 140010059) GN=MCAN_05811 PE=4 SV=1: Sulfotransfer_3 [Tuwongella immobilis]
MSASPNKAKPREWAPHIWEGLDWPTWIRLLVRNRFAVAPKKWYVAGIVSCISLGHTLLNWMQRSKYGARIAETKLQDDPIFIIGHWRSGTTLLHELLILDDRHSYPTTYQCLEPHHFLLTQDLVRKYLNFLMPERRPMDNMAAGWDRPQEDEFALCMMGQPTTYLDLAFPNHPSVFPGSLDLSGLTPWQLRQWKRAFFKFVQTVTFDNPKRMILKSPPHTARIPHLLDLFPRAKFIHIVRNPYVVYPSTINLWTSLGKKEGLHPPRFDGLSERVFQEYTTMFARLEEARPKLRPDQFFEMKFEDLVASPIESMRRIYGQLDLGKFQRVQPAIEGYFQRNAGFERNKYQLAADDKARITERWGHVIRQYDYPIES